MLRVEVDHRVAAVIVERQHLGKDPGVFSRGRGLRKHGIEFVELRFGPVAVRQPGSPLHLADDGV
jgi:hypothetical protein